MEVINIIVNFILGLITYVFLVVIFIVFLSILIFFSPVLVAQYLLTNNN